jgi:hypothetical protein
MSRGGIPKNVLFAILAGATFAGGVAGADSMRCGKWVVTEAATKDELLSKCGQPQSRDVTREEVTAINPSGARVKTGAFTVTERWIYQPTTQALPMAVLIVDNKIVSLQRAD